MLGTALGKLWHHHAMHQSEVRAALLLAAIEADHATAVPDRAALDAAARAATAAPFGSPEWIRSRTRLAWERLLPAGDAGSTAARAWLARTTPVGLPILAASGIAFLVGAGIDRLAGAPYLRLVEPAIFALIAFNLGVYAVLGLAVLRTKPGAGAVTSIVLRGLARLATRMTSPPPETIARLATPSAWARFTADWRAATATLDAARIQAAMHAAAAALALGVIAGLYVRGLTTDYAVGWESTFLDADAMHALVHALLGPASALTGLPLPDRDTIALLRVVPGTLATGGGAAASLIHLNALSLLLAVVLPRSVLAGFALRRALAQRRDLPLPDRLRASSLSGTSVAMSGDLGRLVIVAHGAVDRGRAAALGAALPHAGEVAIVEVASGDEDTAAWPSAVDTVLILAPMTATPEDESHGRLLARLRLALPAARIGIVVDTEAFERRFGQWPARVEERRAAWRSFATRAGVALALLDLASNDAGGWRATIDEAFAAAPRADAQPR